MISAISITSSFAKSLTNTSLDHILILSITKSLYTHVYICPLSNASSSTVLFSFFEARTLLNTRKHHTNKVPLLQTKDSKKTKMASH